MTQSHRLIACTVVIPAALIIAPTPASAAKIPIPIFLDNGPLLILSLVVFFGVWLFLQMRNTRKQTEFDEARNFVADGAQHHEAGRYELAVDLYSRALERLPEETGVRMARAGALIGLGRRDDAVRDYTKVLSADPKNADALFRRAQLMIDGQSYDAAIGDLDRALKIDKGSWVLHHVRAEAHLGKGDAKAAVDDCSVALKSKGDSVPTLHLRALALDRLGAAAEAARDRSVATSLSGGMGGSQAHA